MLEKYFYDHVLQKKWLQTLNLVKTNLKAILLGSKSSNYGFRVWKSKKPFKPVLTSQTNLKILTIPLFVKVYLHNDSIGFLAWNSGNFSSKFDILGIFKLCFTKIDNPRKYICTSSNVVNTFSHEGLPQLTRLA